MIERILQLIDMLGISAYKFTSDLGISSGAVADWKKGRSKPSADTIVKIADYFDVSCDYLLIGKERTLQAVSLRNSEFDEKIKLALSLIVENTKILQDRYEIYGITQEHREDDYRMGRRNMVETAKRLDVKVKKLLQGVERHERGESRMATFRKAETDLELTDSTDDMAHTFREVLDFYADFISAEEGLLALGAEKKSGSEANKKSDTQMLGAAFRELLAELGIDISEAQTLDEAKKLIAKYVVVPASAE